MAFRSYRTLAAVAAAPLLAITLASCGTQTGAPASSAATGNPSYFYDQVQRVQALELDVSEPATLAAALPNRVHETTTLNRTVSRSYSQAVVVGLVQSVEPGVGYDYSASGEQTTETSFEAPEADARDVIVRVNVNNGVGIEANQVVEFRMGVLLGAEPDEFMASLRGLNRVAVLLERIPDGPHAGEFTPIMSGAGVAQVNSDDTLAFPGLGADAKRFKGTIATAGGLVTAASSPRH